MLFNSFAQGNSPKGAPSTEMRIKRLTPAAKALSINRLHSSSRLACNYVGEGQQNITTLKGGIRTTSLTSLSD